MFVYCEMLMVGEVVVMVVILLSTMYDMIVCWYRPSLPPSLPNCLCLQSAAALRPSCMEWKHPTNTNQLRSHPTYFTEQDGHTQGSLTSSKTRRGD